MEVTLAGRRDVGHAELELAEGVVGAGVAVAVDGEGAPGAGGVGDEEAVAEEAFEADAHGVGSVGWTTAPRRDREAQRPGAGSPAFARGGRRPGPRGAARTARREDGEHGAEASAGAPLAAARRGPEARRAFLA